MASESVKVNGIIGISGAELSRYATFYESIMHMDIPRDTAIMQSRGASIAKNRNNIADQALKVNAKWVWYVDDDQIFKPNTLKALIARDVDVVSGLYVQRNAPFIPHVYDVPETDIGVTCHLLKPFEAGMKRRLATGAGCLLIKTKVFKELEPPFWRLGQLVKDEWCDDIDFFKRVRQAGFDVWCDYDVTVGHIFSGEVWPIREPNGNWGTTLVQGQDKIATWGAAQVREEDRHLVEGL